MTSPDSDPLIQGVEAAVATLTTEVEAAEVEAIQAMTTLEIAEERLGSAVQTLTRTTAALRVLRGQAPAQTLPAVQPKPAGPEPTKPTILPGRPDTSTEDGDVPKAPQQRTGPQCPGCGDFGTIQRIEGYKGTPYTVMLCSSCAWERNV